MILKILIPSHDYVVSQKTLIQMKQPYTGEVDKPTLSEGNRVWKKGTTNLFSTFHFPWTFFSLMSIVYMIHETNQCFMTHSRDFCYVSKERAEVSNVKMKICGIINIR